MVAQTDALFEPELAVPSQVLATLRGRVPRNDSICRLMIAVLDDALTCLEENVRVRNARQRRRFEEAHRWLMATDEGDDAAFSFERICTVLDIDPLYLQGVIRRWSEAHLVAKQAKRRSIHPVVPPRADTRGG